MNLIAELSSKLGLPTEKAEVAAGAVFGSIREKLPRNETSTLEQRFPETAGWISKAEAAGGGSTKGTTNGGNSLTNVVGKLNGLGLSGGTSTQVVPIVIRFMQTRMGGEFGKLAGKVPFLADLAGSQRGHDSHGNS